MINCTQFFYQFYVAWKISLLSLDLFQTVASIQYSGYYDIGFGKYLSTAVQILPYWSFKNRYFYQLLWGWPLTRPIVWSLKLMWTANTTIPNLSSRVLHTPTSKNNHYNLVWPPDCLHKFPKYPTTLLSVATIIIRNVILVVGLTKEGWRDGRAQGLIFKFLANTCMIHTNLHVKFGYTPPNSVVEVQWQTDKRQVNKENLIMQCLSEQLWDSDITV